MEDGKEKDSRKEGAQSKTKGIEKRRMEVRKVGCELEKEERMEVEEESGAPIGVSEEEFLVAMEVRSTHSKWT